MVKKRSIALAILFSIITLGIYDIYWFICLTNDSNTVCEEHKTAGGWLALLYTCITFGVYGIYWNYKLGQKVSGSGTLYLLLSLFGLGWINFVLAQSELNNHAE